MAPILLCFNMNRGLVIGFVLVLCGCANNATAFSTLPPSAKLPPRLIIRVGGSSSAMRPVTSLKANVLGAVDTFYKTMPLASAFLTCGIKASLADMVAQKRASKDVVQADEDRFAENDALVLGEIEATPLEKRRTFAFLLYGGLYQGELDC